MWPSDSIGVVNHPELGMSSDILTYHSTTSFLINLLLHLLLHIKMLWPTFFPSWSPRSLFSLLTRQKVSISKVETLVEAHTSLATLFHGLEGSKLVIPSLEALSPVWKVDVNPHLKSIRNDFNSWVMQ